MKDKFLFLLLCLPIGANAQKDNSIFWEISGNGLAKKSYLYGTMHVNEKVSYRLTDAFYEHLLAADIVSNESNPETWDQVIDLFNPTEITSNYRFYTEFYRAPISRETVASAFTTANPYNKILSGIEEEQTDFQETSVLDMFIFQTGKKYRKKIVGLEDARSSILTLLKLQPEDVTPPEENKAILLKLIKNKTYTDLLKQYYREKDMVMIDSVFKLVCSKKAHNALIVDRNIIMARSLDSLAKTGSVFSGVGAAHLGGKKGIIQLLREKGYTLKPVADHYSEVGRSKKKTIEEFFPDPGYIPVTATDKMLSVPLSRQFTNRGNETVSLDFSNGAATSIKRFALNDFLRKDNNSFDHKVLDSLFFENIPGEIIEKKYFETNAYRGYDIKNITKTGNNQRYRFYITPLELIAVSMTGNGNYVRQYENAVFDKIKINPFSEKWEKFGPKKGGFTVDMPAYHAIYGNDPGQVADTEIQAYDPTEKGFYFVIEKTLNEASWLEQTDYEHKQIHSEFYRQHDADTLKTASVKNGFTSESTIGSRKIRLKSVIQGPKYYLLGTVNASETQTGRFFNSFATAPFQYQAQVKTYVDTVAHFRVDLPEKFNPKWFLHLEDREKESNGFNAVYKNYTFSSESGKSVNVDYTAYHRYSTIENLDSLRTMLKREFTHDYASNYEDDDEYAPLTSLLNSYCYVKKGFKPSSWNELTQTTQEPYAILSEDETFDSEKHIHTFNAVVSRPGSQQAVRYKVLWRPDAYFMLRTLTDRNDKNDDPFVEKTFHSLAFTDSPFRSVFDNKLNLFLNDVISANDSTRTAALNATYELDFKPQQWKTVTDFVAAFDFKPAENQALVHLLAGIGAIKDERNLEFMEKIYKRYDANPEVQLAALSAIAAQKSPMAYKKILELMKADLPLGESFQVMQLFSAFEKDPGNSKILIPAIFDFYSTAEYQLPIVNFCSALLESGQVTAKNIGKFKKTILADATLQYKRNASRPVSETADETYTYDALPDYVNLLAALGKDKQTDQLFEKIKTLPDENLKAEMLRLGMVTNQLTEAEIQQAIDAPSTRFLMLQLLLNQNNHSVLYRLSDDEIAQSAAINFLGLTDKDHISALQKKTVDYKGKSATYFFYRVQTQDSETEKQNATLYTIAFLNDKNRINPQAFRQIETVADTADEEREAKYKDIINRSLNEEHWRASFGKQSATAEEIISYQ